MALKWLKSTVIYPGGIIVKTFSIDLDSINLLEGATSTMGFEFDYIGELGDILCSTGFGEAL
jgi:hypothetical protein